MGIFGTVHGLNGGEGLVIKKATLPKICHTYPTIMKLGTVMPYLKNIKEVYESPDIPLEFC